MTDSKKDLYFLKTMYMEIIQIYSKEIFKKNTLNKIYKTILEIEHQLKELDDFWQDKKRTLLEKIVWWLRDLESIIDDWKQWIRICFWVSLLVSWIIAWESGILAYIVVFVILSFILLLIWFIRLKIKVRRHIKRLNEHLLSIINKES